MTTSPSPMIVPGRAQPPEPAGNPTPCLAVRPCRDCGRDMISQHAYRKYRNLRGRYARHAAHGMCHGCYDVARDHGDGRVPARRRRNTVRHCRGCGRDVISAQAYYRLTPDSPERRARLPHGGFGLCATCYRHARNRGTLPDPAPRTVPVRTYRRRAADGVARDRQRAEVTVRTLDS
jgi:hypothetical protein